MALKFKKINNGDYALMAYDIAPDHPDYGLPINIDVKDSATELEIKITRGESTLVWDKITLEALLKARAHEISCIGVKPPIGTDLVVDVPPSDMVLLFDETIISKGMLPRSSDISNSMYMLYFDKTPTTLLENTTLIVRIPVAGDVFTYSGPFKEQLENAATINAYSSLFPQYELSASTTSVAPDSSVTVTITTTDPVLEEVWLEPVCGIVNKTRVKISNGTGKFKVYSNGLETGDVIRVRTGFRKTPGMKDITVNVT